MLLPRPRVTASSRTIRLVPVVKGIVDKAADLALAGVETGENHTLHVHSVTQREGAPLRILTIRFKSSTPFQELEASWLEEAPEFNAVPGLLSKTWIQEGDLLGGIYTFRDQASVDAYVAGPIVTGAMSDPILSDFRLEQYDVLENLSAITRGIPVAVAR
jgi:Putative mono-oxygenase ydhR